MRYQCFAYITFSRFAILMRPVFFNSDTQEYNVDKFVVTIAIHTDSGHKKAGLVPAFNFRDDYPSFCLASLAFWIFSCS